MANRGKIGRIDQLAPELKETIDRLLREGVSQVEIRRRMERPLAEAGERPLSVGGLSRYASRMEEIGKDLRETEAMANALTAKLGDRPTGEVGRLTVEMLKTLAFKAAIGMQDDLDPETINQLALAVQRLERAHQMSAKREQEMRDAFAAQAESEAKKRGIDPDTAAALRAALTQAA